MLDYSVRWVTSCIIQLCMDHGMFNKKQLFSTKEKNLIERDNKQTNDNITFSGRAIIRT